MRFLIWWPRNSFLCFQVINFKAWITRFHLIFWKFKIYEIWISRPLEFFPSLFLNTRKCMIYCLVNFSIFPFFFFLIPFQYARFLLIRWETPSFCFLKNIFLILFIRSCWPRKPSNFQAIMIDSVRYLVENWEVIGNGLLYKFKDQRFLLAALKGLRNGLV